MLGCGAPTHFPHLSLHLPLPVPSPHLKRLSYTSSHTSSHISPSSYHTPTHFPTPISTTPSPSHSSKCGEVTVTKLPCGEVTGNLLFFDYYFACFTLSLIAYACFRVQLLCTSALCFSHHTVSCCFLLNHFEIIR